MEDKAAKVQAKPQAVMKKEEYGVLRTSTNIGIELGKWFGYATVLEVVAGQQAGATKDDRSVLLGSLFKDFHRDAAITTYALTSTVLFGTSAVLKAAYKL